MVKQDPELTIENVDREIRKRVGRYVRGTTNELDDLHQEAVIHAWKIMESGDHDGFWHVVNKGLTKARAYASRDSLRPFGAPKLERDGFNQPSAYREKVFQYVQEYLALHNEWPTGKAASEALGIPAASCNHHIRRYRQGKFDHAKYEIRANGERRISDEYIKGRQSLDTLGEFTETHIIGEDSFEDNLVSRMAFMNVVGSLPGDHGKVLALFFCEGLTAAEIAEYFGTKSRAHTIGHRKIAQALLWARRLHFPETLEDDFCSGGHRFTPETTRLSIDRRNVKRFCTVCDVEKAAAKQKAKREANKKPKKVGPPKKETCLRGHNDWKPRPGSNRRYCRTCNIERNKANYAAKKKG